MKKIFKKLMLEQVQRGLEGFSSLAKRSAPKNGWIRTIREALGISTAFLGKRLGCSRTNITLMEQRETTGNITLKSLEEIAQALNCKLVYGFVPIEPLEDVMEKQARAVAKKQIELVNHSMKLEQQGLSSNQLQQQEDELVEELLSGNPKKLWSE
jgi:predicted DNA-binding mobile mystery protein A